MDPVRTYGSPTIFKQTCARKSDCYVSLAFSRRINDQVFSLFIWSDRYEFSVDVACLCAGRLNIAKHILKPDFFLGSNLIHALTSPCSAFTKTFNQNLLESTLSDTQKKLSTIQRNYDSECGICQFTGGNRTCTQIYSNESTFRDVWCQTPGITQVIWWYFWGRTRVKSRVRGRRWSLTI